MAEKSGFFNSIGGDRKYKADFFAEYFSSFIGNGVFPNPSTNLQVLSSGNMTLTLKAGKAWINGYYYNNEVDMTLNIDNADGILNRIDRIVLRFDIVTRAINAKVKKGTSATSPAAPALQRDANAYELGLAEIYIGKGVISVTQANITDLRQDTTKCGIVHGTVDQVDTTTLFNQYQTWLNQKKTTYDTDFSTWTAQKKADYENWYATTLAAEQSQIDGMESQFASDFNTWFDGIKSVLDGNTIGNLTNEMNAIPRVYKGPSTPSNPKNIDLWVKYLGSKNVQITQRNADNSVWDDVFPMTKAINVATNDGISMEDQLIQLQTIQTAGGSANAITLTGISYSDGFTKTFIVSNANNGAATTVNGKPLYKPNTTTPPTLTKGKAVSIWYDLAKTCFFLKASAEGNTVAAHVLAGDSFSNDADTGLIGTMPNNGALSKVLPINGSYTIPAGYTSGGSVTQNLTTKAAATIVPTTSDQTIAANQYLTGIQTIKGDPNLISPYIVAGKSIFNVAGSATIESLGGTTNAMYTNPTYYQYATPSSCVDEDGNVYMLSSSFSTTATLYKFDSRMNLVTSISWTKADWSNPFIRYDRFTNLLFLNSGVNGGAGMGWYDTNLNFIGVTYRTNRSLANIGLTTVYNLDEVTGDIYRVVKTTYANITKIDINGNIVYSTSIPNIFYSATGSNLMSVGLSLNKIWLVDGNSSNGSYWAVFNKSDGSLISRTKYGSMYIMGMVGNGTTDYVFRLARYSSSTATSGGYYKEDGTYLNAGYGFHIAFSPTGRSVVTVCDSTGDYPIGTLITDGNLAGITAARPTSAIAPFVNEGQPYAGPAFNSKNEMSMVTNGKNVAKIKI